MGATPIAGDGRDRADGVPALRAGFTPIYAIAIDTPGTMHVADDNVVRPFALPGGEIRRVAGNGESGYSGDGGLARFATFKDASKLTFDRTGNLYVADDTRIRRITPQGIVTTVAGTGDMGFSGDGGPAVSATLGRIIGLAADSAGALHVLAQDVASGSLQARLRKVVPGGTITSVITPFPGCSGLGGLAIDAAGTIYYTDLDSNRVMRLVPGSTPVVFAGASRSVAGGMNADNIPATQAFLSAPVDLAVDAAGNVYIAEYSGAAVRRVSPNGVITSAARNIQRPLALAVGPTGIVFAGTSTSQVFRILNGVPELYAGTRAGNGTWTGDGGLATDTVVVLPRGIALSSSGNLYVSVGDRVREVLAVPPVFTFAPASLAFQGIAAGEAPAPRTVRIASADGIQYTVSSSASWLRASMSADAAPSSIQVSVNPAGLAPGSYSASLSVASALGSGNSLTVH